MELTRLDPYFAKPEAARDGTTSLVLVNPTLRPGSLVFAGSNAVRENIGSQVASRLAVDHFISDVIRYFSERAERESRGMRGETSLETLESAFRAANNSVYAFGHKLAAGGRMAASLLALIIEDDQVAAGRAGNGSAYLFRRGELFPFFAPRPEGALPEQEYERLVGAHSLISVELASVALQENDAIAVFSHGLQREEEGRLLDRLESNPPAGPNPCEELMSRVLNPGSVCDFCAMVRVGPKAIYLAPRSAL